MQGIGMLSSLVVAEQPPKALQKHVVEETRLNYGLMINYFVLFLLLIDLQAIRFYMRKPSVI
jgi:hypothetical protein